MSARRSVSRRRLGSLSLAGLLAIACQACTTGDFGRREPNILQDTIFPAVRGVVGDIRGVAVSSYALTGDEAELRARSETIIAAERGLSPDRTISATVESVGLAESTYQERRRAAHTSGRTAYDRGPRSRRRDTLAYVVDSETGDFVAFGEIALRVYRGDEIRRAALTDGAELSGDDIRDTAGRIRANRRIVEQTILAMRNRVDDYRLELRRSVVEHPDAYGRAAAAIGRMARAVDRIDARLRPRVFPEERIAGPRRQGSPRIPDTDLMGG
jgi:hypothetical protein